MTANLWSSKEAEKDNHPAELGTSADVSLSFTAEERQTGRWAPNHSGCWGTTFVMAFSSFLHLTPCARSTKLVRREKSCFPVSCRHKQAAFDPFSLCSSRWRYSSRQMAKIKNTWKRFELITNAACFQRNFMEKGCLGLLLWACPCLMTLARWCTTLWLRFPTHFSTWLTLLRHLSSQITEGAWALFHRDTGSGYHSRVVVLTLICFPGFEAFELVSEFPAKFRSSPSHF